MHKINIVSIDLIKKIKKFDNILSEKIQKLSESKLDYQNFKIKKIRTNENNQVNNPSHEIDFDKENYWILGVINTGKTTYFDKIYDFFVRPMDYGSPIKTNILNSSTLALLNQVEDLEIILDIKSNSDRKVSEILINSNTNDLQIYGLWENKLNLINFITQKTIDDEFFKQQDFNIGNFSDFSYNYLIKNNILQIFDEIQSSNNQIKQDIKTIENELISIDLNIINLENETKDLSERKYNIELFLNYTNEIRDYLENYKRDEEIENLMVAKKEILRKKKVIKNRLNREESTKKYENKVYKQTDKNIKDLYYELDPFCPICGNVQTLKAFKKKYDKASCYLCGEYKFDYEIKDTIKVVKKPEKVKDGENLVKKIDYLNDELTKIIRKININLNKKKKTEISNELRILLNVYYLDLIRPGFSFDEEIQRKKELKENFEYLYKTKTKDLESYKKKKKTLTEKQKKSKNNFVLLKSVLEEIKTKQQDKIKKLFNKIVQSISEYWQRITNDPIGDMFYFSNSQSLQYVTVSNNNKPWPNPIRDIKKDNQLSDSALNALRYAIHLSFLKILYDERAYLPLKFIIIDTPDYEINSAFYNVLEEDFIKKRNFQIIILSTRKSAPFESWTSEKFEKYKKRKKMDKETRQMVIDYFLKPKKNNLKDE